MKATDLKIDKVYMYIGGQANLPIQYNGMQDDKYVFTPVEVKNKKPVGIANALCGLEVQHLVIAMP